MADPQEPSMGAGMLGRAMDVLRGKLASDIAWSLASLVVLAASGVIINLLIARLRDAAALGVFSQAYAIYLVAAQIAAFGLHHSVLRHTALHADDQAQRERLLTNAAGFAIALGLLCGAIVWLSAPAIGRLMSSPDVGHAIAYAALGLALFPLNKVLLAYLNGLRHMKAFAALQSVRYVVVMVAVAIVSASQVDFATVTLAFLAAELWTAIASIAYIGANGLIARLPFDNQWTRPHFGFGARSLLSGLFVELNARVDILVIGLFLADREAGIYAFAAMLADGLYHLLAVIRINFNPVLVAAVRDHDWPAAQRLLDQSKRYLWPGATVVAVGLVCAFYVLAVWIAPAKGLLDGLWPLVILMSGLAVLSAFLPFENLLLVSGHPGYQTLQHMAVVSSNVALGLLLVPVLGITGAALGTTASYFAGTLVLVNLSRRLLGWNLVVNEVRP